MIEIEQNHYELVASSITGERHVDEQTFTALAILTERLERVRNLGGAFAKVTFSPAAKRLQRQNHSVALV